MAVSVGQFEQAIEKMAPKSWAEQWDNPGLLVGASSQKVDKVLLTLDGTTEVVAEAVKHKASLIISHHPLMFKPLKNLRLDNLAAQIPLMLFRHGISFYAAHTNLDQSRLSSSITFAGLLGLEQTQYLEVTSAEKLFKIVTFVPVDHVDAVRAALAAEGVGAGITDGEHSDNYAECFFQTAGEGMFRPLAGAEPVLGDIGVLNKVAEIRLESIVEEKALARAVKALHRSHPYEEPAYDLIPLKNTGTARGYGMIGYLPEPVALDDLWQRFMLNVHEKINMNGVFAPNYDLSSVRLAGDLNKKIRKVAITNGSGSSMTPKAIAQGADLFITGDIDYHGVLDSLESGMAVAELGHFLSEIPMMQSLYEFLRADKTFNGIEILISKSHKVPWNKR